MSFRKMMGLGSMLCIAALLAPMARAADEDKAFDKRFVKEAAQASLALNDISRLAKEKSRSDGVKHYAEEGIGGNKKLLDELKDIAKDHDYKLPDEPTAKQKDTRERLSKLDGTDFDVQYMSNEVENQESLVELYKKASSDCTDKNLREFAEKKLDVMKDHLENAKELYKKVKEKQR